MKLVNDPLLKKPSKSSHDCELELKRKCSPFSVSEEFKWNPKQRSGQFNRQYAHAYNVRLWSMRPPLEDKVRLEWDDVVLKKIADLCEASTALHRQKASSPIKNNRTSTSASQTQEAIHGQQIALRQDLAVGEWNAHYLRLYYKIYGLILTATIIYIYFTTALIGTIFKQQPEKPTILEELKEENEMAPTVPRTNFLSDKDFIIFEDETTRVNLIISEGCGIYTNEMVNGVVCALKGKPNLEGQFEVLDVIFATPKISIWPSLAKMDTEMVINLIAFIIHDFLSTVQ